jgi:alpha-galactosidase
MPRLTYTLLRIALLLIAVLTVATSIANGQILSPTPPMGWNSWDAYGLTINEADFKANATVLAGMKQYGWQYAVIDEGWYMVDPFGGKVDKEKYVFDVNGRLIPALNRFPDAAGPDGKSGAGLKPLADWTHAQGLKFGIHLIRGIPRESVRRNTPIANSNFKAADAGDTSDVCPWDEGNYGVRDNAAGQAWYDSMIGLYATWGIDYLKVDCISNRPYKLSEIRQIAAAIKKTGRPIVLSLSPGPTALEHAAEVAKYAQLWRISDDHWDVWHDDHKATGGSGEFPFGTRDAFDRLAAWNKYIQPGHWPDEDMLPFGSLTPHPGWGDPRQSRLTHDEERTEFTLWAISRSPLILGANLTRLDTFTRALITNKDLLSINQKTRDNHPVTQLPSGFEHVRVWEASATGSNNPLRYVAIFNLDDKPVTLHFKWAQLGLDGKSLTALNVFDGATTNASQQVDLTLFPHASTAFRITSPMSRR